MLAALRRARPCTGHTFPSTTTCCADCCTAGVRPEDAGRPTGPASAPYYRCRFPAEYALANRLERSDRAAGAHRSSSTDLHPSPMPKTARTTVARSGIDDRLAVHTGGTVRLLAQHVCVSDVPRGLFDHVDVDPARRHSGRRSLRRAAVGRPAFRRAHRCGALVRCALCCACRPRLRRRAAEVTGEASAALAYDAGGLACWCGAR